jgi:hypothetical protein
MPTEWARRHSLRLTEAQYAFEITYAILDGALIVGVRSVGPRNDSVEERRRWQLFFIADGYQLPPRTMAPNASTGRI